jgi:D-alanyl-D-alanine carboxypeptidase
MTMPLFVPAALAALLVAIAQQPASPPAPATDARAVSSAMPGPLSDTDLVHALDREVADAAAADTFSGIVAIARRGALVHTRAAGLADREKQIAVTPDTRFRIGSMNKMFTAVAILQLAQAGKIALPAPIGRYIPDYPNKTAASEVTVHHLLTHTGGMGDIFTAAYFAKRLEMRTLNDYVALYGTRDPEFAPGSRFAYSNYGFLLLGIIVERVSGVSYYDYVREKIYGPAGMTSTESQPESEAVPNRAVGYMRRPSETGWSPNTDTLPYRGTSAGGGYSTAADLMRFADALLSHKLLDATHTSLLWSGKVEMPPPHGGAEPSLVKYAYGFMERTRPDGRRSVGHGGGAPGQNGELTIFPETGVVIVSLSNLDPPAATRLAQFVDQRVR